MVLIATLHWVFLVEKSAHTETMAVSLHLFYFQTVPTLLFLPYAPQADGYLAVGTEGELFSDHLEAIEMQAETQEVAATSIPDPLSLDGPEGRDIDLPQPLPYSAADSSRACTQNQLVVFRGLLAIFLPEIAILLLNAGPPLGRKEQNSEFRATSHVEDLVQPERI